MRRRHFLGASLGLLAVPGVPATGSGAPRSRSAGEIDAERVVSDSYDGPGLTTGLSESGDAVLFGFDDGNVMVHSDGDDGDVIPHPVNQPVSHILVREDAETAVIGWMDAGAFSLLNLAETDGPYLEHPGLWDLDATPDAGITTSVSYPLANAGTVRAVDGDGDRLWETSIDDAAGGSVAVTDDGARVAVGAIEYWEDGIEPAGQPGVRLYDGDGEAVWAHDLDRGVVAVDVDAESELVVAGTEDGRTIVLDFAGEVIRETDEYGGWIELSDDGSTIVSAEPDGLYALATETGDERWSTDLGPLVGGEFSVSGDGDRVLAANRPTAEFALVDRGESVWTAFDGVGPGQGALADDGETWSTIVTNTEDGTSRVAAFREGAAVTDS